MPYVKHWDIELPHTEPDFRKRDAAYWRARNAERRKCAAEQNERIQRALATFKGEA